MIKMTDSARLLVVDDAADTLEVLQRNLELKGFEVHTAQSVSEAVKTLEQVPIDLVITDLKMPGASGLDLIRHVRENYKHTEIMMITGFASVGGAVEALKRGAEDYLPKPFTADELHAAVERALEKVRAQRAPDPLASPEVSVPGGLIGRSEAMQRLYEAIRKASAASAPVLITGERGTEKTLVASAIHCGSARARSPFVSFPCARIPQDVLENDLFGYTDGVFFGLPGARQGLLHYASGGSVLLDGASELAPHLQQRLLAFLSEQQSGTAGMAAGPGADVRILASTSVDLPLLVDKERFLPDLFYRLNTMSVAIPPLRDRGDDSLLLAQHLAARSAAELGRPAPVFTGACLAALKAHDWPGNTGELENLVRRLVLRVPGGTIDLPDLPVFMRYSAVKEGSVRRTLAQIEEEHIQQVLALVSGNKSRAAEILGIDRKTLREKLKRYAL